MVYELSGSDGFSHQPPRLIVVARRCTLERIETLTARIAAVEADRHTAIAVAEFDHPLGNVDRVAAAGCESLAPTATFDLIVLIAVIGYVCDCEDLLSSLAKRLSSGGLILMTVPDERSWLRQAPRTIPNLGRFDRKPPGRLVDQSFVGIRPHSDAVPWRSAAKGAGLEIVGLTSIPLSVTGILRSIPPTPLVSIRRSEARV